MVLPARQRSLLLPDVTLRRHKDYLPHLLLSCPRSMHGLVPLIERAPNYLLKLMFCLKCFSRCDSLARQVLGSKADS